MTVHTYNPNTDEIEWVLNHIGHPQMLIHTWTIKQLVDMMHYCYSRGHRPERKYFRPYMNIEPLIHYMLREGYFEITSAVSRKAEGIWHVPKRRIGEQHYITVIRYKLRQ